jgi:hypothetical protein
MKNRDELVEKISKLDDRLKVLEEKIAHPLIKIDPFDCSDEADPRSDGESDSILISRKVAEEWLVHFRDFNHQGWHADLKNEIRRELGR